VSSSAFIFQSRVLYPWHNELINDINKLQIQVTSLRTFHNADLIEFVKKSKKIINKDKISIKNDLFFYLKIFYIFKI